MSTCIFLFNINTLGPVLLKARHPYWTAGEIARRIIDTTDPFTNLQPEFKGKMGSGIVNVARAMADDAAARRLGPLFLEASGPGLAPEARVLDVNGRESGRFAVGDQGDRRGVRASFVRWSGSAEPEIAVAPIGDESGSWRVYRQDGVLVAAGNAGTGVKGGLFLAAQDIDGYGSDTLFLGEADGRRAWVVSSGNQAAKLLDLPIAATERGVSALSVGRPTASFLVTTKFGGLLAIIGKDGNRLASSLVGATPGIRGWINRRAMSRETGAVYDILSSDGRLVFVRDAIGLRLSKTGVPVERWVQVPDGENRPGGWRYYEAWPR